MLLHSMFVTPEKLPSEYELEYVHNQLERACDGTWVYTLADPQPEETDYNPDINHVAAE
jgi:hypothetical protein